jgi:hypothetical protein
MRMLAPGSELYSSAFAAGCASARQVAQHRSDCRAQRRQLVTDDAPDDSGITRSMRAAGLRSDFLTEAALQGVPLPEAMAQSQHTSVQQAARYDNDAERRMGRAARLLG